MNPAATTAGELISSVRRSPQPQVSRVELIGIHRSGPHARGFGADISRVENEGRSDLSLGGEVPIRFVHGQVSVVPPHLGASTDVQTRVNEWRVRIVLREAAIQLERGTDAIIWADEARASRKAIGNILGVAAAQTAIGVIAESIGTAHDKTISDFPCHAKARPQIMHGGL